MVQAHIVLCTSTVLSNPPGQWIPCTVLACVMCYSVVIHYYLPVVRHDIFPEICSISDLLYVEQKHIRGGSRNVEGGVLILCRAVGSILYWDWHCGRQCIEVHSTDPSA